MPVIGQPAHTHFTPVVTAVALDRISLSVTYLYNVSQSISRVTLTRTYLYNIKIIVSRSQSYLYNVNPTVLTGPTRLYFHAASNPLPNLPNQCLCVLTPNKFVDAETVNRTMTPIIGTAQSSLVLTSTATTSPQNYYFTRFVTETLTQISFITANTWTYNFAIRESSAIANFPTSATNQPVRVVAYVWRPSTQSKVGDIVDANSASTVDEASPALERIQTTTFSGNQVLGVQNGDVLVFEVLFVITQGGALTYTDTFYYDGTTVNTTKNATVTNHASFLETPQGLLFGAPLTRVSKSSIIKYNIVGRVRSSQTYKYNTLSLASLSRIYRYAVTAAISLSTSYLYNLTGRLSVPSITKYNILVRMTTPKIFRYALNSRLQSSRLYKYNILNPITSSKIYKYNIANRAALSRIYKYTIYKAVSVSRLYKYSIIARVAQTRLYKYNITNRLSQARVYRYALAVKLSRSRLYKYNLLNSLSASSHIRYSLLSKLSLSKIYRYAIAVRVTVPRIYKYNLTSFSHVSLSFAYKYNLTSRRSLSKIYNYNIANRLSLSRAYRYNLTVRATLSRIYRYALTNRVTLSRTNRYNLLIRVLPTVSRNYLYNLLARRLKPQTYLYNLTKTISLSRTYIYRLGSGVSLSQRYLYDQIGRISKHSKYIYSIAIIPSNVLWQITGKNTDFPDSLENLVRDYIKANWSITDPVLGQTPIITSVISRQHQSQVDNFAYDNFRSYYIRVKEVGSEVKNRLIRLNTYEFSTPVEIECYSRRLRKGESYPQLNAMVNELTRIFGTYQAEGIFGVQGITLDRISSMEKERPPAKNIWARKLKIILQYYKVSLVG